MTILTESEGAIQQPLLGGDGADSVDHRRSHGLETKSGDSALPTAVAIIAPTNAGPTSSRAAKSSDPLIEVTAPADLKGGYTLEVQYGNGVYSCDVPPEGVLKGQKFFVKISDLRSTMELPMGHWRDGLCDCCRHGCCHPAFCLGLWCYPVLLAQVMTRLELNWCGTPGLLNRRNTFFIIVGIWLSYFVATTVLRMVMAPSIYSGVEENGTDEIYVVPGSFNFLEVILDLLWWLFFIFMIVLITRTRSYIRELSQIPSRNCDGCEDCCCAFWCTCCTVTQMARHTADYDTYSAKCCNETGLPNNMP